MPHDPTGFLVVLKESRKGVDVLRMTRQQLQRQSEHRLRAAAAVENIAKTAFVDHVRGATVDRIIQDGECGRFVQLALVWLPVCRFGDTRQSSERLV